MNIRNRWFLLLAGLLSLTLVFAAACGGDDDDDDGDGETPSATEPSDGEAMAPRRSAEDHDPES